MICINNDRGGYNTCYKGTLRILSLDYDVYMLAFTTKSNEFRFKLSDIDMIQIDPECALDYVIYVKGMAFNVICDAKSDEQITANKLYSVWQKHLSVESLKRKNFNKRFEMIANLLMNKEKDNGRQETEDL